MADGAETFRTDDIPAVGVFKDTADLLARSAGYQFDLKQQSEGWRIHYAVDADVLVAYLYPSKNRKHGFLFHANPELAELVVRLIGEFILRKLNSGGVDGDKGQLLVLSPHDEELHHYLVKLQIEVQEYAESVPDAAETILRSKGDEITPEDAVASLMAHTMQFLQAVEGVEGPFRAIGRFADLDPSRLVNLVRFEEHRADGTLFQFPKSPQDARDRDFESFSDLFQKWKQALTDKWAEASKKQHVRKTVWALRNDALVLATLEWVNEQIADAHERIVLITGSRNIFDAAAELYPRSSTGLEPTFEALYLRHPQAFLCDTEFFSVPGANDGADTKEFRVLEWLNAFLPKYVGPDRWANLRSGDISAFLPTSAEEWAQTVQSASAAERPESDINHLVQHWDTQVRNVAVKRGILAAMDDPQSAGSDLLSRLRSSGASDWTVDDLRRQLTAKARESLVSLYTSSALLGVIAIRHEQNRIRGIPALRIDKLYPRAQEICSDMQKLMFQGTGKLDLQKLYKDLSDFDRDGYHALLIHGFAYTIRGHWVAARTFCRIALDVADSLSEAQRKNRTGREAAYLFAVAQRRLANRQEELAIAKQYLMQARARDDSGNGEDPRFRSEALAGIVSSLLIQKFSTYKPTEAPLSAAAILETELPRAEEILSSFAEVELREVVAWVTRQIFSNISTLVLLAEIDRRGSGTSFEAAVMRIVGKFRAATLAPDDPTCSSSDPLSDFLYWATLVVFLRPERARGALNAVRKVNPVDFERDSPRIKAIRQMCLGRAENP